MIGVLYSRITILCNKSYFLKSYWTVFCFSKCSSKNFLSEYKRNASQRILVTAFEVENVWENKLWKCVTHVTKKWLLKTKEWWKSIQFYNSQLEFSLKIQKKMLVKGCLQNRVNFLTVQLGWVVRYCYPSRVQLLLCS